MKVLLAIKPPTLKEAAFFRVCVNYIVKHEPIITMNVILYRRNKFITLGEMQTS